MKSKKASNNSHFEKDAPRKPKMPKSSEKKKDLQSIKRYARELDEDEFESSYIESTAKKHRYEEEDE